MTPSRIAATAALVAAVFLVMRNARASVGAGTADPAIGPSLDTAEWTMATATDDDDALYADARVQAFLYMIRSCEHLASDVASGADYQTFYGGSRFDDLSDHPVITGEKEGVVLPYEVCISAGFVSGNCVSTAAGAYQFIKRTWSELRNIQPRLPDFSQQSQDIAAVRLLRAIDVIEPLLSDDIQTAIKKASARWASLPFSTANQRPKPLNYALSKYNEYLGV